jgi:hypothetical protein
MISTTNLSSTEPTTAPSASFVDFVLAQIRCAKLRAELTVNQCEMAIVALSAGMISPEMAILILTECGVEVSS